MILGGGSLLLNRSAAAVLICLGIVLLNVSAYQAAKRLYREGKLARKTEVLDISWQWSRVLEASFRYRPWTGWILCHNAGYLLFGIGVVCLAISFRSR